VCGDRRLAVTARYLVDADDPTQGAEMEYRCAACGTRYFSAWEKQTLSPAAPAPPQAWGLA
jgi:hypothetical protein